VLVGWTADLCLTHDPRSHCVADAVMSVVVSCLGCARGAGLYVGINGCSLKTGEQLEVLRGIPLERIMLETDCPWCEIKPTHASHAHVRTAFETRKKEKYDPACCVKGRAEPCHIVQVGGQETGWGCFSHLSLRAGRNDSRAISVPLIYLDAMDVGAFLSYRQRLVLAGSAQ
jgi:hypothetical protein